MNLKITKKITAMFFTFTSRTIHHFLVPKVMAEAVVRRKPTDTQIYILMLRGVLFMCALLFLTSCSSQSSGNKDKNEKSANQSNYIDAAFINDTERARIAIGSNGYIYLADQYRIHILDSEGNEKKQIKSNEQCYYKALTTKDDGFLACNSKNEVEEYSADGALIKKYNLLSSEQYFIEKIHYIDGKLFVMYRNSIDGEEKYLSEYNLKDEKLNKIEIEHVQNFIDYKENMLLIFLEQDCCSGHMLTYNIRNGEKSDEIHIANLPYSLYPYYNNGKDRLYLLNQGTINIASIKEKKIVEAYTSSTIPVQYTSYYTDTMAYFLDKEHKRIVKLNMEDIKSATSITVLCNDIAPESYFSRVAYDFGIENNGTAVKFINISTKEYTTKLNSMLMSGDESFDIYLLSTYNDTPSYYLKKGVYENLNNYPVVSQKFDEMFEGIKELCSYKGSLFGAPVGMHNSTMVYQINTEMLDRLKLKMPEYDWSWDDFEKYARSITADGKYFITQNSKINFWFSNIFDVSSCTKMDLAEEVFNYDKMDLKNELEFVKRLYEEKYILEEQRSYKKQENLLLNFAYIPINDGSLNESKIIPAPVFKDKRSYPFTMCYFCLNKASQNKQTAAAFLGKCISKETQSGDLIVQVPILYKDKALYNTSVYKEFINNNWNYNVYSYMLKNSYRSELYMVSSNILDYLRDYFEGRITSDEAAEAIYNKMKQIVQE